MKTLFAAGHILPRSARCIGGHAGPFAERPDLTEWLRRMNPAAPVQVDCLNCRSSISTPEVAA